MSEEIKREKALTAIPDKIWSFFTSLKLLISLLLVLAALSVAGTIIEQNKPLYEYYKLFKPETVELFSKLGLLDMYHSWWFTLCLAMLALNITACTVERYPVIIRGMKKKNVVLDETLEAGLTNPAKIKFSLSSDVVEVKIREIAGEKFHLHPVVTEEEHARHFFYEKGKYTRFSFFLTHLSILLIFIGAIIGSLLGFKGYVNINEGEMISSVQTRKGGGKELNFVVKCNSFNVDYYQDGAPKDYRSDLSVIRDGKEVARKTIRVNDPLSYEGITFYQSSYGGLPDVVIFEIKGKDGASLGDLFAPFGRQMEIPGSAIKIEVADYQEHFHLPDGSEAGPVIGLNIYHPDAPPQGRWISVQNPEVNGYGDYFFVVRDIKMKKYTGLQVNKDPGVWVVWTGCIILVAGIMMAFFMSHKKLWIRIRKDKKNRVEVTVGGTTNKNKYAFSDELEKLVASFREVS